MQTNLFEITFVFCSERKLVKILKTYFGFFFLNFDVYIFIVDLNEFLNMLGHIFEHISKVLAWVENEAQWLQLIQIARQNGSVAIGGKDLLDLLLSLRRIIFFKLLLD